MATVPPGDATPETIPKPEIKIKGLPPGWRREVVIRKNGQSAGKTDVYYYSPCGKKFRSKPQIARFLGDCADLSCFDFSRAGTPGDGTQRRRARDRTAKKSAMELLRPPPLVRPLTINPLRPSGPIRRTCGVIKLPVTCVAPTPTDKDSIVPNGEPVIPPPNPSTTVVSSSSIVVPQLWESRLFGVKAYNHETGSEILIEFNNANKPQNGLSVSPTAGGVGASVAAAGDVSQLSAAANLQNLIAQTQSQNNTQQTSLGITPGTHNLIQAALNSTTMTVPHNASNPSYNPSSAATAIVNPQFVAQQNNGSSVGGASSNVVVTHTSGPISSLLQQTVPTNLGGGATSRGGNASVRENGQQPLKQQHQHSSLQASVVGRAPQSHLVVGAKDFRQQTTSGIALSQSTNVTATLPAFRVSPVVVNGPAVAAPAKTTTSVNAETVTHFVSDSELRQQEEKVRLLRQKLMAAQNSA